MICDECNKWWWGWPESIEDGKPGWCNLCDEEAYPQDKCHLNVFKKMLFVHIKMRWERICDRLTYLVGMARLNRERNKKMNRLHRDEMLAMWDRMKS